ncbi:MAG: hypothetical protein JWO05_2991 [Gemmatimonadetes bacterium]|nr:hypothetical protein [Gemmatimonadota bacterium]
MTRSRILSLAALVLGLAHPASGQGYPFSQRGSVTQDIALTKISISYGRPVARGRALFGALVPWDSIWHPGADSATRIVIDRDIVIEDNALQAGEYSLWLVPREHARWTVIFHRAAHTFHKPYPGASGEVLRLDVSPEQLSNVESLVIYFPRVIRDEGDLRIHWGTTGVTMHIRAPYKGE